MIKTTDYSFLKDFQMFPEKKGNKKQILEYCSQICHYLFANEEFSLFEQFTEDITPFLSPWFPKILTHWKERSFALSDLVNRSNNEGFLEQDSNYIEDAKHFIITS